jgi:hypothetical protein
MVSELDFGVEGNQGEIKFFQRFILFGDDQEVFPDPGNEAGGSYLGTHESVGCPHRVEIGEFAARRAVRIFPIDFTGTESDTLNDDTLCLAHDRSISFDA